MHNSHSPIVGASEIVSTLVTKQVQILFRHAKEEKDDFRFAMTQIHLYLSTHIDLLSKKFVFFTQNDYNQHWWGWFVVNHWVKIAQVMYENMTNDPKIDIGYSNHVEYV